MTTKNYEGSNSLTYLLTLLKAHYAAKADVPTAVSDLANDSGFVTANTTYTISLSEGTVTLTGSDGSTTSFSLPEGVAVDAAISATSENPVQNKAVSAALADKMTSAQVDSAIDAKISDALAGITGVSFEIVEELPAAGEAGTFYLKPNGGSGGNAYDEYVYAGSAWEKVGTTDVDLSGYVQSSELVELTNNEVQAIWDSVMGE